MDQIPRWPAWKFGMKEEEVYTTLQDRYNTTVTMIQDPVAFGNDVLELSTRARGLDEFHRLLAERRQFRLNELDEAFEYVSLELIADPGLFGEDQEALKWANATRLFRFKSLDTIVQYFDCMLPAGHMYRRRKARASSQRLSPPASVPKPKKFSSISGLLREPLPTAQYENHHLKKTEFLSKKSALSRAERGESTTPRLQRQPPDVRRSQRLKAAKVGPGDGIRKNGESLRKRKRPTNR